jgi:type II secretory pathway component PulM
METGFDKEKLLHYKAIALKHLGDRTKLRLSVVFVLTLLAVVGVYTPMSDRITQNKVLLSKERQRIEAIADVESLRREIESFRGRLPEGADTNEWVQYILAGLREVRVKLRDMSSKPPMKVGPYRTVTLAIEVEGTYAEVKRFVEWLEQSDRLLRVDSSQLEKKSKSIVMRLVLLGLVRKNVKAA